MFLEDFIRRTPPLYRRARLLIDQLAVADTDQIREFRETNLRRVVRQAEKLAAYPKGIPFHQFPYLAKDEIRARPEAYVAKSIYPSSKKSTSGTTGAALVVHRSLWCVVFEQAIFDFMAAQAGADFHHDRMAVLRGMDIKAIDDQEPPFWRHERGGKALVLSSNHLSKATIKHFLRELRQFSPKILWAYPSVAAQLCELVEWSGERLRIPLIMTGSEMLPNEVRRRLIKVFNAKSLDYYGQGERVAFAYSLEEGSYRFFPSYGFTEFLPISDVGDEGFTYEIVGTQYHNARQVFVRYRTGDFVRFAQAPGNLREIGDGLATFEGISGRHNDVLLGPRGEVLVGIDHIPRGLEAFGRFQFIQPAPDLVEILVVDPTGGSSERERSILNRARIKIPSSVAVKVHFVEELRRNKAGKTPLVFRA
jgi:phenylacetate-CoA ligase